VEWSDRRAFKSREFRRKRFLRALPLFSAVVLWRLDDRIEMGGYEVVVREPHAVPILIIAALLWNT
jgi:hypothetical protein